MQEKLSKKAELILEEIKNIREAKAKQEVFLKKLEQQAQLMLQNIDPEQVQTWGYDPYIDKRISPAKFMVYNYVILKNGTRINLINPILVDPL